MNARFRIGNVYRFKEEEHDFFISDSPLIYTGYDVRRKHFVFKFKGRTGEQICPKDWIERGLVEVETEWTKGLNNAS